MKHTPRTLFIAASCGFFWLTVNLAHGQQVYKCGNAYSQTPCANAEALDVQDPRSTQQKRSMDKQTVKAGQLAGQMQRERQEQEQKDLAANQPAASLPKPKVPVAPNKPTAPNSDSVNTVLQADTTPRATKPKLFRPRKSGEFTALAPKPPKPIKPPQAQAAKLNKSKEN